MAAETEHRLRTRHCLADGGLARLRGFLGLGLDETPPEHSTITAAGAKHPMIIVSQCGHNAACIFIGRDVRSILFPPQ